jgi:hypothetical protein
LVGQSTVICTKVLDPLDRVIACLESSRKSGPM